MISLIGDSANELYAAVCVQVRRHGRPVRPRGMPTTEVLGAHLCLANPRARLVDVPPTRILNPAFAVAEALWILSGSDDPWIFTFNRSLAKYADDGRLQGAYGPRMRRWRGEVDQLAHLRRLLAADPDSRQAIVQLYDPQRDTRGHRDVPCTLSYRFFLRGGRLEMHTTMRSNDVWLGLPYDLFTATLLQELVAGWLGADLGTYHHHVDSLHLYAQHEQGAEQIASGPVAPSWEMPPIGAPADGFTEFLNGVIAGVPSADAGPPWTSFARMLTSYRAWAGNDRTTARAVAAGITDQWGGTLRRWYDHLSAPVAVPAGW